jgi:hypothetical protein
MVEYALLNAGSALRSAAQRAVLFMQDLDWRVVVGIALLALFLSLVMKPGTRH